MFAILLQYIVDTVNDLTTRVRVSKAFLKDAYIRNLISNVVKPALPASCMSCDELKEQLDALKRKDR